MRFLDQEIAIELETLQKRDKAILHPVRCCEQEFKYTPNEKQREFILALANPHIINYALQACRSGGKTKANANVSGWGQIFYDGELEVLVMSGSLDQTMQFYRNWKICYKNSPRLRDLVYGKPHKTYTEMEHGGYVKCIPSTEFSSRSPHPDWLLLDELVLIDRDKISAAWPMVRDSENPKRVMSTTASQTKGAISLDVWEDFKERREELELAYFEWGPELCPWLHKRDSELSKGYYDILDPTGTFYKIEYEGKSDERRGAVFNREHINFAVDSCKEMGLKYEKDLPTIAGVDWGYVHPTVITLIQIQGEFLVIVLVFGKAGQDVTFWTEKVIPFLFHKYNVEMFYCDLSHKFENKHLEKKGLPIVEVNFAKFKDLMIGETKRVFEQRLFKIPEKFRLTLSQFKRYIYDPEKEKPMKTRDDYVDSAMCSVWGASPLSRVDYGEIMSLDDLIG